MSNPCCCAHGASRKCARFPFVPVCLHTVVVHVRSLCNADRLTPSRHGSRNKTTHIHPSYFVNLVAEPMEAVHAELVRLATELEAVEGQVQTECNAIPDFFARTITAMSGSGSQHDRRLNHGEAGRHLPQQFGGSRLDHGDRFSDGGLCGSPIT